MKNQPPTSFKKYFIQLARPYRWSFIGMLFIGVYSSLHNVVQPYVVKLIIDAVSSANQGEFLDSCLYPAIALIIMGFVITFIWRFYNWIMLSYIPNLKADIIRHTTAYLRGQSYAFFQDHLSGEISDKISSLTNNIHNIINTWFNIARQALTIILAIFMAGSIHPYFAIVFFVVSVCFLSISFYCSNSIKPYAKEYAEARSKNTGTIVDSISNVVNMLLFAREKYEDNYLEETTIKTIAKDKSMQIKNMMNASILGGCASLLFAVSMILLLILGDKGLISAGDFALIFLLSITVIDQVWFLTESLLSIGEQVGLCQKAIETIYTPHLQKTNPVTNQLRVQNGEINLQNIHFRYGEGDHIFEGLNLTIPAKTKIGLVGYSGGGKSSLVSLITRLFDVQQGDIEIDNQSIYNVHRQSLREHIAFIPQQPSLFHRTIFENLQYGKPDATKEEIILAAKKAHAHNFIERLPHGYDTIVGEGGVKLSGGQRQRIAIARAILKDAPILILDEATSSLDSKTEAYIQQSLHTAMEDRTVIVIAHRLSTVLSMDQILVLDKGKIIEQGNHHELIEQNGFYKALWDSQSGHSFI